MKRFGWLFGAIGLTLGMAAITYFFFQKFQHDRGLALNYSGLPDHRLYRPESQDGRRTVKTYTAKELEEARRRGQVLPQQDVTPSSQATAANDAAVQRNLQTIQEINRINEMNQRLQEQQQRLQKQK